MTNTNQQTGGVARQLLQRIDNRVYGALPHSADRIDGQRQGATEMHAMLSAEARAIIHRHTHEVYSEPEAVIGMRVLAKHLGLAIDHDETEGE